jgi:TetR/AcrR family transcriptional regulator, mexJK operon transcriptional repressor
MRAPKDSLRGRPTQEELEARKARVLTAAEQLFIERGFSDTSVAEITRRANVTPRLVTAHFGDKVDIFIRVIGARTAGFSRLLLVRKERGNLEEIMFGAAKFAWTVAYSPTSLSFLRLLVGEGERFAESTSRIARDSSDQFFGTLAELFRNLFEEGLIGDPDAAKLAKYFVDLVVGFSLVQAGMSYMDRVPDDEEIRDKIRFFCRGIVGDSRRPAKKPGGVPKVHAPSRRRR